VKTIRWTITFEDGTQCSAQASFEADRDYAPIRYEGNKAALRDADAGSLPKELYGLLFQSYGKSLLRGKFKSAEKEESGEWLVMKL
jgi:hypothetical protein